jgi:flap endonuclease-1
LKWLEPDEDGLVKYLCEDKAFNEDRVKNGAKKLSKARTGTTQGRLDSFFKVLPSTNHTAIKRKVRTGLWLKSTENFLHTSRLRKEVQFD